MLEPALDEYSERAGFVQPICLTRPLCRLTHNYPEQNRGRGNIE